MKQMKQSALSHETAVYRHKLSVREAAAFLGISKSFLDKRRLDGTGPRYLQLGRRVLYDAADLELWAVQRRRTQVDPDPPTFQPGEA